MPTKVLSVDDNPIIGFLVGSLLRPYDCVVFEATDGEEGLAAAVRERPDLIILDIIMPVMDGISMLKKLRENPEFAQTPVIMLTAWSGQETLLEVGKLGISDYLVKPFSKEQLIEKANRILHLALKSEARKRAGAAAGTVLPAPVPPGPPDAPSQVNYGVLIPDNVVRLGSLVSHQDVDMGEISKVIGEDEMLTTRLLRATNTKVGPDDYKITLIEEAVVRNGIGCVFLLTMGDLVQRALFKTFQTMLDIQLESVSLAKADLQSELHVLSEVEFTGKARGKIYLHLDQRSTGIIVTRLLELNPKEKATRAQIDDVISELTNIIGGNFLSNLADAGLPSRISLPQISYTADFRAHAIGGELSERFAFRSPTVRALLDININPWNE